MSDLSRKYLVVGVTPPLPNEDDEPPRMLRTFKLRPMDTPTAKPITVTLNGNHPNMTKLAYCASTGAWCELKAGWLPPNFRFDA